MKCNKTIRLNKEGSNSFKIPTKEIKEKYSEEMKDSEKPQPFVIPDDFVEKEYLFHFKCWKDVLRNRKKKSKQAHEQTIEAIEPDVSECDTTQDSQDGSIPSEFDFEMRDCEEEIPDKKLSKDQVLDMADVIAIDFLKSRLKANTFSTRRELTEFYNDTVKVLFIHFIYNNDI